MKLNRKSILLVILGLLLLWVIPFVFAASTFDGLKDAMRSIVDMIGAMFSSDIFRSTAAVIGFFRFILFWLIFCAVYIGVSHLPAIGGEKGNRNIGVVISVIFGLMILLVEDEIILKMMFLYKFLIVIAAIYVPLLILLFLMWVLPNTAAGKIGAISLFIIFLFVVYFGKSIIDLALTSTRGIFAI